jgi:hypothetical protein
MMHAIQVLACPAEFKPLLVSPGFLSVLMYWLFILDISILDSLKKKNFRSVSVCPNLEVLACFHQWSFVAWHHHFCFSIANSHLGNGSCELKSCKIHPSCCCYRWLFVWVMRSLSNKTKCGTMWAFQVLEEDLGNQEPQLTTVSRFFVFSFKVFKLCVILVCC